MYSTGAQALVMSNVVNVASSSVSGVLQMCVYRASKCIGTRQEYESRDE